MRPPSSSPRCAESSASTGRSWSSSLLWVLGMLQGDFGTSIFSNLPVSRLILQRLEPTLSLTLATLLVAVCLAIPLGVLAAWKAHRLVDRLVMGFAVLGFAMPVFLVGYVLIYVFAVEARLASRARLSAARRRPVAVAGEPHPAVAGARRSPTWR